MDIININIGQAGIGIGDSFVTTLAQQHKVNSTPVGHPHVFFRQTQDGFIPRSICIDMNQSYPSFQNKNYLNSYDPKNLLCDSKPSLGIFGQSRYNTNSQFKENFMDRLRSQFELSNKMGGFIMIGAFGGGTGSGLFSLVETCYRQQYPSYMMQTFRLMPFISKISHPVEIYNTTFSINSEIDNTDMALFFDNAALTKMLTLQGKTKPNFQALNHKMGKAIANSTIPYSFKGDLNTSQRKIATNIVLFPRLHFLAMSQSSHHGHNMLSSVLEQNNCFYSNYFSSNPNMPFFNIHAGVRSNIMSETDTVQNLKKSFNKKNYSFVEWMADSVHLSMHEPVQQEQTTLFMNGYHMLHTFENICEQFTASFRRKAFVHHYTAAGMDQMEFTEAESNLNDLQWEYRPPSGLQYDDDDYDENSESEVQQ